MKTHQALTNVITTKHVLNLHAFYSAQGRATTALIAILLLIAGLIGIAIGRHSLHTPTASAKAVAPTVTPSQDLRTNEQHTVELFENAAPSVANITVTAQRVVGGFFSRRVQEVEAGNGSGFVWDEQGHVVTNFHVVRGASGALVSFNDATQIEAELVGTSPDHDLAVLKIDPGELKLAGLPLGTSNDLKVGQAVYAIGNPFALDHTLTTGVVSALDRQVKGISGRTIEGVIQTDAAINPGNSGGPLMDSSGRVIGINTMIYSPSGASAGIGFAVPIDTVRRVVPQIIATGTYSPPQLGIYAPDNLTRSVHQQLKIQGIVIADVIPDSPADKLGLKGVTQDRRGRISLGDVLQAIDDQPVNNLNELFLVLDRKQPGDTVKLTIRHQGGKTVEMKTQLIKANY